MSLIIFAVVFSVASGAIIIFANNILINDLSSKYITMFVKGTARGSIGLFESNSMIEAKRAKLQKRNSKF